MSRGEVADTHYQPDEPRQLPSGEARTVIERPVPDASGDGGWEQYGVAVIMDEGRVFAARVESLRVAQRTGPTTLHWREVPITGGLVELTADECRHVEQDFSEDYE